MFFQQLIENFKTIITKKYFCFEGRAGRQEFWMWILAVIVVGSILAIIPKIGGISGLWYLATALPTLGVTARRLHDTGKTAWLILLSLIPIIGNLIVLIFCIPEGTNGDNQYGPLPAATPVEE
ncbi:MAG TPA: DUF805 domain-containing protein [Lentisphaeria bacterium]|nr:DUF805 domain-containing protein [Lentisphaeria bacterium]